jgi:hypothetical protein
MPEIINSLWIGRPLSVLEQLSIVSFLQNGYEFHLYCYDETVNVPPGTVLRDAAEILPASEIFYYQREPGKGSVAAFANLFRFKLLLERGGWWVDTDVVCLRRFDFAEPVVIASERSRSGTQATNAILKLPRGHAVARLCFEAADRKDRAQLIWGETGPLLVDRIVRENGFQQFVKPPEVFCPLDYWDWDRLLSLNTNPPGPPFTNESHAIHLWHEMWRRAGIKLDAKTGEPQPDCEPQPGFFDSLWQRLGLKPKPALNDLTPFAELLRKYGLKINSEIPPASPSDRG